MAGAVNVAKLAVQIEAQGGDQVIGHIGKIGEASEGLNLKFARVGAHVAEATERISNMETIGIGSFAKLGVGVAEFAQFFGPAGLLVSGVAAAAGVIVSMFTKAREEAKKTREAFDDEIGKMLDAGDRAGLMKKLRDLYQGTPSKDFADGIKAMQEKLAGLKSEQDEASKQFMGVIQASQYNKPIAELEKKVQDAQEQFAKLSATLQKVDSRSSVGQLPTVVVDPAKDAADAQKRADAELKAANELFAQENAFRDAWVKEGQERMQTELGIEANYIAQGKAMLSAALTSMGQDANQQAAASTAGIVAGINDELAHGALIPHFKGLGFDLSSSIVDGFTAGFSGGGIKGALLTFGGDVLTGLGNLIIGMAVPIMIFGHLMNVLHAALVANPLLGGFIALAVGAALLTLGKSLSSAASGNTSSAGTTGSSIAGAGVDTNAAQITNITLANTGADQASKLKPVRPIGPVVIVGPNDGSAQRQLAELMKNGRARGLSYG